jgi:hypothetical protein
LRCVFEQGHLLARNGVTAPEYYLFGLDRPDLSWERKRHFIGTLDNWRWLRRFNALEYRFFTEDKVVFKQYLTATGVPVPRLLAVFGPLGSTEAGAPLRTDEDLGRWLREGAVAEVVIKPVLGAHGVGVLVLGPVVGPGPTWERVPHGRVRVEDVIAHVHRFPHRRDYLVEERLRPHPTLAGWAPGILHTARVVTLLHGDVEILAAELRIATGATAVDNFSAGNMAAPVDLASGRLGAAISGRTGVGVRYPEHPEAKLPIEGVVVPDWKEACDILRRAARSVPFNRLLGWDLALTDRGPVVLEANDLWDPHGIQMAPDQGLLGTALARYLPGGVLPW